MNLLKVDVKEILNTLGIQRISDLGDEINFSCPSDSHYRGDLNPSAYINKNSGVFYCFSCGYKGNLIKLISDTEGVSIMTASRWLHEKYDFGEISEGKLVSEIDKILFPKEVKDSTPDLEPFLDKFKKVWLKSFRNLTPETLNKYEIGWDNISGRVVIPYRDIHNKVVGFKGRLISKNANRLKYKVLGDKNGTTRYGFPTFNAGEYVYGINSVSSDCLVIVEGEFDAIYLRQIGITGSVGIGTSKLTDYKLYQLCNKGDRAIVMLDPDEAGGDGASEVFDKLSPYMPVRIAELKNGDPSESSNDEIYSAINTAKTKIEKII